jgi:hypothetical protein
MSKTVIVTYIAIHFSERDFDNEFIEKKPKKHQHQNQMKNKLFVYK